MKKKIFPLFIAAALLVLGTLSVLSINELQGNARVINYTGVVRGATQRLVKQEISGEPNDALINRLDGIIDELLTGEGDNNLIRIKSERFQELMLQMKDQWQQLKAEIMNVRQGADTKQLFTLSEDYFVLADTTVSAAEDYTKDHASQVQSGLIFAIVVFLLLTGLLTWYNHSQDKRRAVLDGEEADNRQRREYLDRMSETLKAPMNDISELIYIADVDNYDLLFLNDKGKSTFHVDDFDGCKCYKVLQGLDAPCDFCVNNRLVDGEIYTWEITNRITGRHYLLKDRLIEWDGRRARMEIAFDMTEAEEEKQQLRYRLELENMLMECVHSLYEDSDLKVSIPVMLRRLGEFLQAERAYVITIRGQLIYNDFEWCAEGCEPQIQNLQGLPVSVIDRWRKLFEGQQCVVIKDLEAIRAQSPSEYDILSSQNISRLVAAPLNRDGKLFGYVGVDNPPLERMLNIASALQTLCYFLMLSYRREDYERQLSRLSYYDTLTGFYNRNRYMTDLDILVREGGPVGIVYLDVNGLKDINDMYGHAAGDDILIESANRMKAVFGDCKLYRIGGDEFVVICQGIGQMVFSTRVGQLKVMFHKDEMCRAAIGSTWTQSPADIQQIVAMADAQMYEDKKAYYRRHPSSPRYRHHSDEVLPLSDPDVLRKKLNDQQFIVYLQPKISSLDRSTVGAEALIRYKPAEGSLILPGNFLPLLEEAQTISQVDFYVFEFVCSKIRSWAEQGKQSLPVSVNFSRFSLVQPCFVKRLCAICEKHGVQPHNLEIEITESVRKLEELDIKTLIEDIRRAGFIVALDDFGTEYANLSLLSLVDFDVLKLDKSMVDDVADNPKTQAIVESIVETCRKLHVEVVAEGIETEDQLEALRECGVRMAQGFLFSRPVPIEDYEQYFL